MSLPIAMPPSVAVALTEPPSVAHVAVAWAFRLAFAKVLQKPFASAVALLPWLALAVAVPTRPEVASASLASVALAVACPS